MEQSLDETEIAEIVKLAGAIRQFERLFGTLAIESSLVTARQQRPSTKIHPAASTC